ncbi:MAG TPA: transcription termination/antitermination protein NusG [Anaerolineales bacterium]|nr:transcription termination/antitermination protein NusG [Anaerolineales bacterium]HRQ91847.1 transcription termination/antitermination protein NusG [Anaerolineales bacterium]
MSEEFESAEAPLTPQDGEVQPEDTLAESQPVQAEPEAAPEIEAQPEAPVTEEPAAEIRPRTQSPRRMADEFARDGGDDVPDFSQVPTVEGEHADGRAWYVVHCYSGYENKVRHNLEQRIESMGMKNLIFDVVVPTEEEIEVKEGKRRTVERRVFPGYILVNMILSEESWFVVRNTPGVTSFVGQGNTPLPLRPEEVSQIVKRMEAEAPRIKVTFKQGERVRIVDGPFNDFRGTVSEIDMERAKVRVMVNFFGRETPVELDFLQVEKA